MSWDQNNLACILVFPPWQRKGLGALLMGISYEISKREKVLGGPEKPISELGKKGYKRFWAGEIARWILSLNMREDEETIVDVDDCVAATWIVPEDCLLILREMDLLDEAGLGPPKKKTVDPEAEEPAGTPPMEEDVPRLKLSKAAVRKWVAANGLNLQKPCDPDGFVEGYAMKEETPMEEEE